MSYSEEYVYLLWDGGNTKHAFPAKFEGYEGGRVDFPAQLSRNLSGTLLVATGTSKRHFLATLVIDDNEVGTVVGSYTVGSLANLQAAYGATDLQIQAPDDGSPWNARLVGSYQPRPLTPIGTVTECPIEAIER
jgi:hypothetical protein